MLSRALLFITAAAPLFAQASLAGLIQTGERKTALEKIRTGADVNEAQPDGTRPIHWAVYRVDYELVDALIAKKAVVEVANEFGSTPLAEAAKLGDAKLVKALLDAGARPNAANADDETAFMLGIKTGELPVVQLMMAAGANVNAVEKFRNQTPLMYAAAAPKNAAEITKLLLAKGANVKARALYIDWDSQISSEPRAQYRATGGLTALTYAARSGCLGCVDALIASGAGLNVPTPEGVTPLMMALDNDHNDVAKLLLDRGANPHVWDWWGRTALYIAVDRKAPVGGGRGRGAAPTAPAGGVSSMQIITALLEANVDPSPELNMHRPSRGGNSGRFADNQLSTGCTPLFRAVQLNDAEVIRALLAKGASPNVNAMGFTPFLLAAGVNPGGRGGAPGGAANFELLDLMFRNGADVNAQVSGTKTYTKRVSRSPSTNEGMGALHSAVQGGRVDLVKYLLGKGANTELLDGNGRKPIDLLDVAAPRTGGPAPQPAANAAEIRTLLETARGVNPSGR